MVFEEIVEGDITRLVAVFHSQTPGKVGPVRSARTTDVELLPHARPAAAGLVGRQRRRRRRRAQSARTSSTSAPTPCPGAYGRDGSRRAPHNLYAETDELWAAAPGRHCPAPGRCSGTGKTGEAQPAHGRKARGASTSRGAAAAPSSPVSWRWDAKARRLPPQPARPPARRRRAATSSPPRTSWCMVTEYGQSAADLRSPEAHTVGSGELFVFTNGARHPRPLGPARHRQAGHARRRRRASRSCSRPGNTWVELPQPGGTAAITG